MDSSVKSWYRRNFSSDGMGNEIDDTITFNELYNGLNNRVSFCRMMGVNDSIVRERVFHKLASLYTNNDYSKIYNLWYWS